ncbi:uncharacterized protein BDV17DRAFT_266283 [Aspergillus undulatus]|uniref:uncharacterized protein n=1 Tax=Aspergillus undulatus TaxID=1810928 RepID=UPI003CCE33AC
MCHGCSVDMRFFKTLCDDDGDNCGFEDRGTQPSYHKTLVAEGSKIVRGDLRDGDRRSSCYLYRLPLHVRMRIYQFLFKHDFSSLEIGRLKRTGIGNLAILRVSHIIYHEASIALYHSLSYRKLLLRTYSSYSASLLTRFPKLLQCCGNRQPPCHSHKIGWHRPLGSVLLLLGSTDMKTALQRRWSFMQFLASLSKHGPIHVYNLTVVANDNWNVAGFDEGVLVKALFSGTLEFLGKLNLRGFNEQERNRLVRLIHDLKLPGLKLERQKRKIQGHGFSVWICESPRPPMS